MSRPLPRMGLILALVILVLDQLTKWLVVSNMELYQSIPLAPLLYFTYVLNPGGAFSFMAGAPDWLRLPVFLSVPAIAVVVAWHYWKGLPLADRMSEVALGLVVGGAFGNFFDRLRLGQVIDFMHVDIPTGALFGWMGDWVPNLYTWPIFNVADSAVCVGLGLLAWRVFKPLENDASGSD